MTDKQQLMLSLLSNLVSSNDNNNNNQQQQKQQPTQLLFCVIIRYQRSTAPVVQAHKMPKDAFSQLKANKTSYSDITEKTDMSSFNLETRLDLFNQFIIAIDDKASKEKKEHRVLIKSMNQTINKLLEEVNSIKKELEEAKKSPLTFNPSSSTAN